MRHHRSTHNVIYSYVDGIINLFTCNSVDYETIVAESVLMETLMIRDKALNFPHGFSLTFDELNEIINFICTC
jgi:hypothetical protein